MYNVREHLHGKILRHGTTDLLIPSEVKGLEDQGGDGGGESK